MYRFGYILFFLITVSTFAINPPKTGNFPAGFWEKIHADESILKYGDPGWINKLEILKEQKIQMSKGLIKKQTIAVQKFKLPVLLGSFSNKAGVKSVGTFQQHLFGSNANGNMTDYYKEVSKNQFELTGDVFGWYTADQSISYYASDNNGLSGNFPNNGHGFVRNVVSKADGNVNYALYDNDGLDGIPNSGDDDGYADAVLVVYAGAGPDWGANNSSLWPYQSSLGNQEYTTNDLSANGGFIKVSTFAICPEIAGSGSGNGDIRPIGVYVHEFGHILGLPDLYDRTNQSNGIGGWGLMGSGSWGGDNAHPAKPSHPTAWSKVEKGWVVPIEVNEDKPSGIVVDANGLGDNEVYKIWEDGYRLSRYFLIENRQKIGFDQYIPSGGMMIYHIDENQRWGSANWSSGPVNDNKFHKLVDIEEADGLANLDNLVNRGDAGDIFPGSSSNFNFTDITIPNSRDYNGLFTGVEIYNINYVSLLVSARIKVRNMLGYSLKYDEKGISGWRWGYQNPTDTWGGVLFNMPYSGSLEAVDIGISNAPVNYQVLVYRNFQNLKPSNLITQTSGTIQTNGWSTVNLPTGVATVSANENIFVVVKISNKAYAISYDSFGSANGSSYISGDGITYSNSISTTPGGGDINLRARVKSSTSVTSVEDLEIPEKFSLSQNYPNPFNPSTVIEYSLPSNEYVTLKIFDILGNEVNTLVNQNKEAGTYKVDFNASNLASGLYIYKIQAGNFNQVRKMMLLK